MGNEAAEARRTAFVDNAFFHGARWIRTIDPPTPSGCGVQTRAAHDPPALVATIIPVRDGLVVRDWDTQ